MTLLHHNIPYQATISENDQPSQILMLIFPLIVEYILRKKNEGVYCYIDSEYVFTLDQHIFYNLCMFKYVNFNIHVV